MATPVIRVKNQKIGKLNPVYIPSAAGSFDVPKYMSKVFIPVFRQPMVPTSPVDILVDKNPIDDSEVIDLLLSCCGDNVNSDAEEMTRSLLHQTIAAYNPNTNLLFREMFAISAGAEAGLPEPGASVIYAPATDIIPAASKFIQGTAAYEEFFASFAYYFRLEAFGAYFINEQAFSDFKIWFQQEINTIQTKLDATCTGLVSDFMKMKLDNLTESFKIRNTVTENVDEFCFARVFIALLMRYFGMTSLAGIMPFDTEELFCPKNIVLINVERFAHSTASAIAKEKTDIQQAIDMMKKINMISNRKLTQLAPVTRALRKTQAMAAAAASNGQLGRAARTVIRSRIMTKTEYLRTICQILEKMKTEMRTMNVYKSVKTSFAKPNRRDPDNYNLQGKIISTKYRPDLHIYLDTSGSVSERNYETAIKLCIQLAKKLNVNLYLNSFSHIMSQTWQINCKDRSLMQIYQKFQNIPKVTGNTDYEQIWHFINRDKKRQRELSLIITDFEWAARSNFVAHPKNLYYVPFSNMSWDAITHAIERFMKSALHNDPLIRRKILA